MEKNEIILFENQGVKLEVNMKDETVWLNREQLSLLFDRDIKTIGKHINNALQEELDSSTVAKFATIHTEGSREVRRDIEYYNLDMIISIGYRVKSKNGIVFRKWATKVLKDYMIKGYAINEKRLKSLEKAANFLYMIIKNHVFIDGNKRIAATLFIYFLQFYNILYKEGQPVIDNNTLVALTLLIAESNPKEKQVMVDLVLNFLT